MFQIGTNSGDELCVKWSRKKAVYRKLDTYCQGAVANQVGVLWFQKHLPVLLVSDSHNTPPQLPSLPEIRVSRFLSPMHNAFVDEKYTGRSYQLVAGLLYDDQICS